MKKVALVLVLLFAAAAVFANPIQLGTFPVGRWLDPNYDAIWDFSSSNIRILGTDGSVIYDFSTKTVENFRVFLDGVNPGISFSCVESERSYRFVIQINTNLVMEIQRTGQPQYSVNMRRQ